ncbi:hypothetical protein [Thermodesulfovibrio yellowstonii]|uniref:Uncharacterized protein n=1 Tax=Thermodesulfovibrio yellowstonii TaxID=28262 RepID=A0A9W6GGB5_9BACT|nr:hypothetical protein [Thermodesulfovibrio islandicus]GLI53366.1 hypothetical protein TISLANDTSLP1_10590 [Thermodesulfovibrio islandicus]
MNRQILGVVIGVVGILLWFMPLVSWQQEFMGVYQNLYQTGYHIGGIAYLQLLSMFAYSFFSWFRLNPLRIISSTLSLLICLLFLFQVLSNAGWGLIGLIIISIAGIVLALRDNKIMKDNLKNEK